MYQIKEISKTSAMVILSDNTKLFLSDESEKDDDDINNWESGDWVVIPYLPSSSSLQLINTRTNDRVKVSKAQNVSLAK